ncbi:HAD hydrolase-like protein [Candidatus Woesearchaeota archaeon]|nr:HAD hydrolase-like protein [Candidatus Woesearchaeota archaeon]
MIKKEIKAVFLDFDLTLVDSRPAVKATYKRLSKLIGKKPTKKGFQEYVGSRFSEVIEKLHKESGIPKKKLIDVYHKTYIGNVSKLRYYGKSLVSKLNKKGITIIILTNNHKETVKKSCDHFNIRYNKLIADKDMKKGEKKHDAIKKELKSMRLNPSEALYVGDHINDIKEADKAGISSVIVPTGVFKKLELKRHNPDLIIPSLNKLAKVI